MIEMTKRTQTRVVSNHKYDLNQFIYSYCLNVL